jgi:hypothetical protein
MMDSPNSVLGTGAARLKRGALWVIFALVLMIPKVNRLRRRRRTWTFIRILVTIAGASIVVVGLARGHAFALIVVGALLLLFALLVRAERPEISVDARAKKLGALIAVDGGHYVEATGKQHRAKLFVGADRLWVLDDALHVLMEISLPQIQTVAVEGAGSDWKLCLECEQKRVELIYEGNFAEHLATVAEATVRSRLNRELPVLR